MEPSSFEDFARGRTPALLRYAHALTGDPARAEDLVQDALAGLYRHWRRVGAGDPYAYARRAVLNGHLSRWRRLLRFESSRAEVPDRAVPDAVHLSDERRLIHDALAGLPPRQRAVLVLRYLEDLTEEQVADLLGIAVGTVKSQSAKAMARLRALDELQEERR